MPRNQLVVGSIPAFDDNFHADHDLKNGGRFVFEQAIRRLKIPLRLLAKRSHSSGHQYRVTTDFNLVRV